MLAAVNEIAKVTEDTSAGAQEISASTEQQSAAIQEVARSANHLAELSEQLTMVVSRFKI